MDIIHLDILYYILLTPCAHKRETQSPDIILVIHTQALRNIVQIFEHFDRLGYLERDVKA